MLAIGVLVLQDTLFPPHPAQMQVLASNTQLTAVALSNDGTLVAAGDAEGHIWIWETATGQVRAEMAEHQTSVKVLTFLPQERQLVSGSADGQLILWNTTTGELIRSLGQFDPGNPVFQLDQSGEHQIFLFGVETLAPDPDAEWIVVAGERGQVMVIALDTGVLLHTMQTQDMRLITSIAVSADGSLIATGGWDGVIHLWDAETGDLIARLQEPDRRNDINALAFREDDTKVISVRTGSTVEVWSVTAVQRLQYRYVPWAGGYRNTVVDGELEIIVQAEPYPQSSVMPASWYVDPTIRVVSLADGQQVEPVALTGHTDYVSDLALDGSARVLASSSWDGTVRLWRVPEFEE